MEQVTIAFKVPNGTDTYRTVCRSLCGDCLHEMKRFEGTCARCGAVYEPCLSDSVVHKVQLDYVPKGA